MTNTEIASRLTSLAQLLSAQGENPFKIKAYRRAAETITSLGESIADLVRSGADLTQFAGIGKGISGAITEIVQSGGLRKLDSLRTQVSPEVAAINEFPRLDPKLVLRVYKKLGIASIEALRARLAAGEITAAFGARVAHHLERALTEQHEILLYDAEPIAAEVRRYLIEKCGVVRAEITGEYRRRVEVVRELSFLVETADFAAVVARLKRYGGRMDLQTSAGERATFRHSSGIALAIEAAPRKKWGLGLILGTGSAGHVEQLEATGGGLERLLRSKAAFTTELAVYRKLGLANIDPELREGNDEIARAARGALPELVTLGDIRGELHCHSTSSDGAHTIEEMALAARSRGYSYIGIADHSQSLKIAGGLPEEKLWAQIREIDVLNERLRGIRVLKSAEVDILADGSLDYPDALLRELDYVVCSIHSRFALGKAQQTERLLRAMDNPHFTILGHATGRLLLRRPGYEIDLARVIEHARQRGCFFEINASPDRLDLSSTHARLARDAGIKIAINTDAHSTNELDFLSCGIDQARRAGLTKDDILNCLPWPKLRKLFAR